LVSPPVLHAGGEVPAFGAMPTPILSPAATGIRTGKL
jgi:hypothetical protein